MTVEVQPYFAESERYPALIGVRAEGDEYETAYVSKSELADALAENAKLRELMYERAHVYAIQNMTEDELRITATNVMEDNAKLRELLSSYWKAVHCPATPNVPRDYLAEMRELGVEVPDNVWN